MTPTNRRIMRSLAKIQDLVTSGKVKPETLSKMRLSEKSTLITSGHRLPAPGSSRESKKAKKKKIKRIKIHQAGHQNPTRFIR
jgi:hypothetical protein